jgi:tetratricopeptide (TPR) repeat protein
MTVGRLFLLALLVGLAAYYWSHRQAPSPPHQPLSLHTRSPVSTPILPARPAFPTPHEAPIPPARQARLAPQPEPPTLPTLGYATTLKAIAALIQGGRLAEAEAQLKALPPDALENLRMRHYAAVLWNNLGVAQSQAHGASAGISSFRSSLALNPGDPAAIVNLTRTLWETKDPSLDRELLERAIRLAPSDPLPHLALADMLYDRDDLAGALAHLDEASKLATSDPGLRTYLEFVTAKVRRAEKAEQRYLSRQSSHFMVKFDGGEDYAIWTQVLDILEEAYRDIGNRFGYYPSQPITVVLHTRGRFQEASGSPAWADGLFDSILGRIQVPTQGALTDQAWLARVLRHEFVHALLHQRVEGRLQAVPTWLNEGLAMQLAGDNWPEIETLVRDEVRLIPLNALEGGWLGLPPAAARLAYLEGKSATGYLIDRFGMEKVREIVGLLASGRTIGPALHDRLFISYEDFQNRWVEELNQRIRTGRL